MPPKENVPRSSHLSPGLQRQSPNTDTRSQHPLPPSLLPPAQHTVSPNHSPRDLQLRKAPLSAPRPRRSPRLAASTDSQHREAASNSGLAPRSLFSHVENLDRSSASEDETNDVDELVRLAERGELSEDEDEFPQPPPVLPFQEVTRRTTISNPPRPLQCNPSSAFQATQPPPSTIARSAQPSLSILEGPGQARPSSCEQRHQTPSQFVNLGDHAPQHIEDADARKELEKQEEFRRLYVHLKRVRVPEQKYISSAFNVIQQGNKEVRAKRLFLVLSGVMERTERTARDVLEEKGLEKGKDFITEYNRTITVWSRNNDNEVIPDISQLEQELKMRQHPRSAEKDDLIDDQSDIEEDVIAAHHANTGVSMEEFTRLMLIFRDVTEAADDLRKSGQDLSRADLDTGRTRNAFWTDRIERIFNDQTHITNEKLDPPLQHIDPGRPVTVYRDGSCLQDLFAKFRKEFTDIYGRWNVSGNMEHSTFINFCSLPNTKTLTRGGARALIAFRIFGFGTPNQNTLLLDFCSRQMAEGSGARLESGLGPNGMNGLNAFKSRKRASDDSIHDDIRTVLQGLKGKGDQGNDPAVKRKKAHLDDIQLQRAQREDDRFLMQTLMDTHEQRVKMNHSVDNRVTGIIDNYYNRLVDDAAKRMQPANRNN